MLAEEIAHAAEHRGPDGGAGRVEQAESRDAHRGETGKRRNEHPSEWNESADQHRSRPVPVEKAARAREHGRTHARGMFVEEIAAPSPEHERHRCAQRGGYGGNEKDYRHRQPPVRRECRSGNERRIRGEGDGDPFRKDEQGDDQIAVIADEATEVADHRASAAFRRAGGA